MVYALQSALFLTFLFLNDRSSAKFINTALISNCIIDSCEPPFQYCDKVSGACQLVKRQNYERDYLTDKSYYMWNSEGSYFQTNYLVNVTCNEDGNYPAHDCGHFYRCDSGSATLKSCNSPGYPYFDPVLQRCSSSQTCPTFDCFNNFYDRAGLKGTLSSFFGYCFEIYQTNSDLVIGYQDRLLPHTITRCYGKDMYNTNTGRCEPCCLQEGLIPDTSDCHKYFLCSLVDAVDVRFAMTALRCPEGQAFQQSGHRCVPEAEVKFCTVNCAWPL